MRIHLKGAAALLVVAAFVATPAVAFADTPTDGNADALAAAVSRIAPEQGTTLDLSKSGGDYTASTATTTVKVADNAIVSVTSNLSGASLAVQTPTAGISAVEAKDGTLTYDAGSSSTAVAVQAVEQGVRIATILKDASAATEYSYPLQTPVGSTVTRDADTGAILVTGADGKFVGGFAPAWAKDANGTAVPTRYEIRGSSVVQVVDIHTGNFTYPVVADPYFGVDLIDHASWVHYSDGWTIQVYPTGWARQNAGNYAVGTFDWDELYTKYSNRGLNTNLNGMRDQLICHQQFVAVRSPGKASWNIDEWRPDVGYAQTVAQSCNPGGARWFD